MTTPAQDEESSPRPFVDSDAFKRGAETYATAGAAIPWELLSLAEQIAWCSGLPPAAPAPLPSESTAEVLPPRIDLDAVLAFASRTDDFVMGEEGQAKLAKYTRALVAECVAGRTMRVGLQRSTIGIECHLAKYDEALAKAAAL